MAVTAVAARPGRCSEIRRTACPKRYDLTAPSDSDHEPAGSKSRGALLGNRTTYTIPEKKLLATPLHRAATRTRRTRPETPDLNVAWWRVLVTHENGLRQKINIDMMGWGMAGMGVTSHGGLRVSSLASVAVVPCRSAVASP